MIGTRTIAARAALGAALLAGGTCMAGGAQPDEPIPNALPLGTLQVETGGGDWIDLYVEVAATPGDQARGLMHRESLSDGHGMLFVFADDAIRTFWMKDTLIPLDMIFISSGGRILGIVHEAEPLSLTRRYIDEPSRHVLEVPGGWAREKGVMEGNHVRFAGVPAVAEPFGPER